MDNNKTICQENCFLSNYNYTSNKVKCLCDVKESSSKFKNMKIDKTKYYENFIDIKNIANINILECYKILFSKIGLIKNYGSYSIIGIFFAHLIIIIIYYSKNLYSQIQNIINKIAYDFYNFDFLKLPTKVNKNNRSFKKGKHKKEYIKKVEQKSKKLKISKKNIKADYKKNPPIKKISKISTNFKNQREEKI